jgi:dipeptidyl aminopeptidase/acylaminoacyl peptidase
MNADAASKNGGTVQSISTNNDVMIINPIQGFPYKKISVSKGDDNQPVYSPDGKYIAFRSAARPGFESDKQALVLHDRSTNDLKNISGKFDLSIGQILWSPDSRYIYFDADREVSRTIYKFDLDAGKCAAIHSEGYNTDLKISADGKTIYFKKQRTTLPAEIFSMDENGGNVKQVTKINAELLADIQFGEFGTFRAPGANGAKIESIIITPPFFDPGKKYPLLFLIHGGPQGNWPDEFHYRWNLQMFAAKGYVVVAPNPRGSFGYGQKFTDEISGDWGGKVYTDLMNSCDYALKNFKYIDKNNTFAAGASYGGYMINWIEGHTSRFNALVCHDGVFDLESMWGSTEELWFPEWEFKGTPYTNKSLYEKWSPHRFAGNFKTPMLVVHGAMDFRVPESQAFELFTTLQRKGIPSKFLYFPDEFHFVVKPQNARLWWSTVFDWFNQYKK